MNNPSPAFKFTKCDNCDNEIPEGDGVFFWDGYKYCEQCARDEDIVCECGNFKKPEYEICYDCHQERV